MVLFNSLYWIFNLFFFLVVALGNYDMHLSIVIIYTELITLHV